MPLEATKEKRTSFPLDWNTERFAELKQVWFYPWLPSDNIGNGYSHTSQLSSALIIMHVLGLMVQELKFADEVEETKGISLSPLLLYFCFSLLWIIPSVKQDRNSSLLYLQVLLWLCSSKHWRRSWKAGLNRKAEAAALYSPPFILQCCALLV